MIKHTILGTLLIVATMIGAEALVQARGEGLPEPSPSARSYLCFEGRNANEVMAKANEAGARGWRMIAAAPAGSRSVWCFEQFSAVRPVSK